MKINVCWGVINMPILLRGALDTHAPTRKVTKEKMPLLVPAVLSQVTL